MCGSQVKLRLSCLAPNVCLPTGLSYCPLFLPFSLFLFLFSETEFFCVTLTGLELPPQIRLASNSQRFACFCVVRDQKRASPHQAWHQALWAAERRAQQAWTGQAHQPPSEPVLSTLLEGELCLPLPSCRDRPVAVILGHHSALASP